MSVRHYSYKLLIGAITIVLAACGGGGGGGGGDGSTTPQDQVLTFTSSSLTGQVGETLTNAASGGAGVGAITYSSEDTAVATVDEDTGQVTLLSIGTTTITANKAASTGFNEATANYSLVVTPGDQTITFADPGPIAGTYGEGITNIASGGAGNGTITYQSSNTAIATVDTDSGVVEFVGVGSVTITATKAADANYNQTTANYQLDIAKADQTIAFSDPGPLSAAVEGSVTNTASGGTGTGAITYSSPDTSLVSIDPDSGLVNLIGAGTATIVATKAADDFYGEATTSYSINIAKANQTISFANPGPVAGQVDDVFTNAAGGGNGSGAISYISDTTNVATVDPATGQVTLVGIGTATIIATKAEGPNYNADSDSYSVNVSPGDQTLTFATPGTVNAQVDDIFSNVATGGNGTGTITYESDDPAVATVDINGGEIMALTTGTATITATKAADSNYNQATATYTVDISPGDQFISFDDAGPVNLEIGNTNTNVASGGNGAGAISYESSDPSVASVDMTTGEVTANAEGNVEITATKAADSNYNQAQANYDINVSLITQTITFDDPGPIEILVGTDNVTNAASGGGGSGAISYESSDTNIATVDNSGVVSLLTTGDVTITATKAADSTYAEAQVSYPLIAHTTTAINGWVGINSGIVGDRALINFENFSAGAEFIRSTDPDCDVNSPLSCSNGASDTVFADNPVNDGTMSTNTSGYYWLKNGSQTSSRMLAGIDRFKERFFHSVVYFNNRYWVVGGGRTFDSETDPAPPPTVYSDVWSSEDGITWQQESPLPGSMWLHETIVFNGKIWIFGRTASGTFGTWSSNDGNSWTLETAANLTFPESQLRSMVVFNGEIWMQLGGQFYSTPDGVIWTEMANLNNAGLGGRGGTSLVVFDGSLWLVGGNTYGSPDPNSGVSQSDVWKSDNGVDWELLSADAGFQPRHRHATFVLNNKLWIMGGQSSQSSDPRVCDIWSTSNGVDWAEETNNTAIDCSYLSKVIVANNSVKLISGVQSAISSAVWETTDGVNWSQLQPHSQFGGRTVHQTLVFNGDLYVIGGLKDDSAASNDIWHSSDAKVWSQITPDSPIFDPRLGFGATVFNNQMWVVGGYGGDTVREGNGLVYNDVWVSSDGADWTLVNSDAPFPARSFPNLVVFNSELWIFGGSDVDGNALSDVWSSVDGVTWIEKNSSADFGPRTSGTVIEYNDELWLIGGSDGTTRYNDVWNSTDGANWTEVTDSAAFSPRIYHAATVQNGLMWIAGGSEGANAYDERNNELWYSSDGITWQQPPNFSRFSPRSTHSLVNFNGEMCVIGGFAPYQPISFNDASVYSDVWCSPNAQDWRVNYNNQFTFP